jgi:hypothetical protein
VNLISIAQSQTKRGWAFQTREKIPMKSDVQWLLLRTKVKTQELRFLRYEGLFVYL